MGANESKLQQQNDNTDVLMFIKTDMPSYYPGNEVYGKLYLRIKRPMPFYCLELSVKAVQKQSFWRKETHKEDDKEVTEDIHEKSKTVLFEYRTMLPIYMVGSIIQPGDYTVPFQLSIPIGAPATIMLRKSDQGKPKASVTYTIQSFF